MKLAQGDGSHSTSGATDILVIEDDALQAHEIETHLQRQGFTVSKLAGGSDSLHNVARIDPRVVIVDYHLPAIDGMTVAARVHRLVPGAAVILVSGRIDFVPPEALDRFGVVAFFKKPINLGALRRLVARLVKNPTLTRKQLASPLARLRALLG
jgi:DNA-binding NtrC family response regulator